MQESQLVLSLLNQTFNQGKKIKRLYRYFYHPGFYESQPGWFRHAGQWETILEKLKKEQYAQLGMDKELALVFQQIIRAIYSLSEPEEIKAGCPFGQETHLDALIRIKQNFKQNAYAMVALDNTSFATVRQILCRDIEDGRFLQLAGYLHKQSPRMSDPVFYKLEKEIHTRMPQVYAIRYQNQIVLNFDDSRWTSIEEQLNHICRALGIPYTMEQTGKMAQGFEWLGYGIKWKNGHVRLSIPPGEITKALAPFQAKNKPRHVSNRLHWPVGEIIARFCTEYRRLYRYYRLAEDRGNKLRKFQYYHYHSLLKTIGMKEKKSVRKTIEDHQKELNAYNIAGEPDTLKGVCPVRRGV